LLHFQVFAPGETLSSPLALHLVFCQVVQDCLGPTSCIRVTREQRAKMRKVQLGTTHSFLQMMEIAALEN
jgi:myosin-15